MTKIKCITLLSIILCSGQLFAQDYVKELERLKVRLSHINAKVSVYSSYKHYALYIRQDKEPNYDDFDMGQSSLWYYDLKTQTEKMLFRSGETILNIKRDNKIVKAPLEDLSKMQRLGTSDGFLIHSLESGTCITYYLYNLNNPHTLFYIGAGIEVKITPAGIIEVDNIGYYPQGGRYHRKCYISPSGNVTLGKEIVDEETGAIYDASLLKGKNN
mgnify:CR=1 FL=1